MMLVQAIWPVGRSRTPYPTPSPILSFLSDFLSPKVRKGCSGAEPAHNRDGSGSGGPPKCTRSLGPNLVRL